MVFASICLRRQFLPGMLAIAGLLFAGCFNGPGTFKCTDGTHCPTGYSCVGATTTTPGLCQIVAAGDGGGPAIPDGAPGIDVFRGVDLVSSLDAPALPVDGPAQVIDTSNAVELGSVADVGAFPDAFPDNSASPDLGIDKAPDLANDLPITTPDAPPDLGPEAGPEAGPDLGPDLPPLKGQGAPCSASSDCQGTLVCADGVCCNAACTEQCRACNLSGSNGICTRQSSGAPASGHTPCVGSSPCGGSCNATSDSCVYPGSSQTCGSPAACSPDLATVNSSACDAKGACVAVTQNCSSSSYCNSSNASCTPKLTSGSCTSNVECTSNNCSSGICCPIGQANSNGTCCTSGITGCAGQCCAAGQTCSAGACQCSLGAFVCGACLSWNFEGTSSPSPWLLDIVPSLSSIGFVNGATNLQIAHSQVHSGSASVAASVLIDYVNSNTAEFAVSPCGTGGAVDLAGYTFTAWVYISGPAFGALDFFFIDTWGPSGLGDDSPLAIGSSILTGSWFLVTGNLVSGVPVNRIGLRLAPTTNWSGTIYIDDVVITGL